MGGYCMVMKTTETLEDFCKYNMKDLDLIIYKLFPKRSWKIFEFEDVRNDILMRFCKQKTVERWTTSGGASFSTYIYRCVFNHISSYYKYFGSREMLLLNSTSHDAIINGDGGTGGDSHSLAYYLSDKENNSENLTQLNIWLNQIKKILEKYDETGHTRVIPFNVLLGHLMDDMTDNEIATKYNMTCANVGGQKRKLVELIKKCESGSIYNTISINKDKMNGRKRQRNYIKNGNAFPSCG